MPGNLKIVALAALLLFVAEGCKKSPGSDADANMYGMRTWQRMKVNSSADSAGIRHDTTTYLTIRTHIEPWNGSAILVYPDSAARYPDTLKRVAGATSIHSFAKATTQTSPGTIITIYDSVIYNTTANSIVWFLYTTYNHSGVVDSEYTYSHTP